MYMRIIPAYIVLGIFITVLFLYLIQPQPKVLLVTPNLNENVSPLYQDDRNVCYKYHREEVPAPN